VAKAALALGLAHRKLNFTEVNVTPLGAVIAAPPTERRELFCRNGLKYYARIQARDIRAALGEVRKQRGVLERALRSGAVSRGGKILVRELIFAARMAEQSCQFMLWQQAMAAGKTSRARQLATVAVEELIRLDREFSAFWSRRNKANPAKCSGFLRWRIDDYRRGLRELSRKRN
jgi:hypothetical protein